MTLHEGGTDLGLEQGEESVEECKQIGPLYIHAGDDLHQPKHSLDGFSVLVKHPVDLIRFRLLSDAEVVSASLRQVVVAVELECYHDVVLRVVMDGQSDDGLGEVAPPYLAA